MEEKPPRSDETGLQTRQGTVRGQGAAHVRLIAVATLGLVLLAACRSGGLEPTTTGSEFPAPASVLPSVAVSSPDLPLNMFKREFTCDDGQNRPPRIQWGPAPPRTAAIMIDLFDVDTASSEDPPDTPSSFFSHWLVYNLPPSATSIPPLPAGAHEGRNDAGQTGYTAPCPPRGTGHRYVFQVFFLDSKLQIGPEAKRRQIISEAGKHTIAKGTLNLAYQRSAEP